MNTGTAVLTTRLPGIPSEYYDYVYSFEEVSVQSYKKTLEDVLSLGVKTLKMKGRIARDFVRNNKNNVIHTSRIIKLIKQ